jgi:tetratricopeptide (TPR) repeat protein
MRTSNTFWFIFLIASIVLMAVFFYSERNIGAFDLVTMPFFALILSVPFAIAFSVLMIRLITYMFMGVVFGTHGEPEKEKYGKAKIFIAEGKPKEAIAEYEKILCEFPNDDFSRQQIAEIYAERLKDYLKAVEEYKKLLGMKLDDNRTVSALNRLADLYGDHLKNRQGAVDALQEIILRYPGTPNADRAQIRLKAYVD